MRSGLPVVRRGVALLVLLTILAVPAVYAAETAPPPPPTPEARIGVPIGVAAEEEEPSLLALFLVWLQARIGVPIG